MKKLIIFFLLCFTAEASAYQYSYIPKASSPTIYNFIYKKREKCTTGERYDYPKQVGVCASCPENTEYLIDETKNKAGCFKCPPGTLLVRRSGYPMCLSRYPVINGKALKPNGDTVSREELERSALRLSADYKASPAPKKKQEEPEKTYHNKEMLKNVCPSSYPEDETAIRQIEICRRLGNQNDFLCPYVEKNSENKWICRACPKNAPYKNKQGGCFTCPYGEEMVSLDDGKLVCASEAPPKKKKPAAVKKSPAKKSAPAVKKAPVKKKAAAVKKQTAAKKASVKK